MLPASRIAFCASGLLFVSLAIANGSDKGQQRTGDPFHPGNSKYGQWKVRHLPLSAKLTSRDFNKRSLLPTYVTKALPKGRLVPVGPLIYDAPQWFKVVGNSRPVAFVKAPGWSGDYEVWTRVQGSK
jgi:hypothetical protein